METTYEERMEHLIQIFKLKMEIEFKNKVNAARNRKLVINEIIKEYNHGFLILFTFHDIHSELISQFCNDYKRGIPIDKLVIKTAEKVTELISYGVSLSISEIKMKNPYRVVNFLAKFVAYYEFITFKRMEYPDVFQNFEQNLIVNINNNQDKIITEDELIKKKQALSQIEDIYNLTDNEFLLEKYNNLKKNFQNKNIENDDLNKLKIEWTGDKNEFYKLIYALHGLKLINNGDDDVTGLVKKMANIFNIELNENWSSGWSKHLNYKNKGFSLTSFFDKLKDAFVKYNELRSLKLSQK